MLEFIRQAAMGAAVMIPTLSALAVAATLSEEPETTRRPVAGNASAEAELQRLRERGMMLRQLNHSQMLHDMRNDAMWRSFYHQQDMIRSQRY